MSAALWVIYGSAAASTGASSVEVMGRLSENVGEVSEIVYFLMGAMTIVEIVDAHQGFKVVTDVIEAKDKRQLMWVLGGPDLFHERHPDNLTTTIVMVSLIKKILPEQEDRKLFGAMTVIAANAGGAWTPIGERNYYHVMDQWTNQRGAHYDGTFSSIHRLYIAFRRAPFPATP